MGSFSRGKKEKAADNVKTTEQKKYIQGLGACIVTKSVLSKSSRLKWIFRENNGIGTGWVAFGDTDSEEYVNTAENLSVVDFSTLSDIEPSVKNIFYMPVGTDLEFCCDESGKYFVDTKTGEEIRQAVKHPVQIAFEKNLKFLNKENYEPEFFNNLFHKTDKLKTYKIGKADFPTGRIALADPIAYLGDEKYRTVLEKCIPPGSYETELSVICSGIAGIRVAAARLIISDGCSVRHELAMPIGYHIEDFNKPGVFSFFGVDAGLACFADESLAKEYTVFLKNWRTENPDKNIYNDYFSGLFQENCKKISGWQTEYGDFLIWKLPKSNKRIAMFSSGMGDGVYSAYWGFDKNGELSDLTIPFMNPEYF